MHHLQEVINDIAASACIYDEDPESRSQSSSETVNCQWGPNVKQLLLRNTS